MADRLADRPARAQQTLQQAVTLTGVGLHSGANVTLRILPAAVGQGRSFRRTDLPNSAVIPAHIHAIGQTTLSTELVAGEASVRTIEHLLATLWGLEVDNATIELDGPEVPLLDGSAQNWVEAIMAAGLEAQSAPIAINHIETPVWIRQGDLFVAALPASHWQFTYGIEFDLAAIGKQWHTWHPDRESFATEIAPARTFGLAHQIEQLRQAGLIKGGSLDNALVCGEDGWVNPPLRFSNEPVRHKLLDLVGDLSLLGTIPIGHYIAYKASHHLHTQLAAQLASAGLG
jgi:UDP-3-O-[3-hydroxymyristoyl] N-acetylglucosamine deacetylase